MALRSTQPLTEMSTRSISWGLRRPVRKADNLPSSFTVVTKCGSLNFLEPSGPVQACNGTALPLPLPKNSDKYWPIPSEIQPCYPERQGGASHLALCERIPYRRSLLCRNSRRSVKLTTHLNPFRRLSTTTHGLLRTSPTRLHSKEYFTLLTFLTLSLR